MSSRAQPGSGKTGTGQSFKPYPHRTARETITPPEHSARHARHPRPNSGDRPQQNSGTATPRRTHSTPGAPDISILTTITSTTDPRNTDSQAAIRLRACIHTALATPSHLPRRCPLATSITPHKAGSQGGTPTTNSITQNSSQFYHANTDVSANLGRPASARSQGPGAPSGNVTRTLHEMH